MLEAGPEVVAKILIQFGDMLLNRWDTLDSPPFKKSVWNSVSDKAETYNNPGVHNSNRLRVEFQPW